MKTGNINIKFVVYFVSLSLFISIIAGIIGGVPFFTLLVRLFFGAIFFAVLGAGVAFILEKFIPEIFSIEKKEDEVKSDDEDLDTAGQGINIVMEEENPHSSENIVNEDIADEEIADEEISDDSIYDKENEYENKDLTETEELIEKTDEIEKKIETGDAGSIDNEYKDNALNKETDNEKESSNKDEEILSINDNLGLDELPNLDNSGGSFSSENNYTESSEISSNTNYNKLGENNDPEDAAKAIKTWLNKDKEG